MAINFFYVWITMGEAFFNQIDVAKLEQVLHRKEAEEGMASCPFWVVSRPFDKRGIEGF